MATPNQDKESPTTRYAVEVIRTAYSKMTIFVNAASPEEAARAAEAEAPNQIFGNEYASDYEADSVAEETSSTH